MDARLVWNRSGRLYTARIVPAIDPARESKNGKSGNRSPKESADLRNSHGEVKQQECQLPDNEQGNDSTDHSTDQQSELRTRLPEAYPLSLHPRSIRQRLQRRKASC